MSYTRRQAMADSNNGPPPSQRATDSFSTVRLSLCNIISAQGLLQLVNFAENVEVCRHIVSNFRHFVSYISLNFFFQVNMSVLWGDGRRAGRRTTALIL